MIFMRKSKIICFIILFLVSIALIVPVICFAKNSMSIIFGKEELYTINNIIDIYRIFVTDFRIAIIWLVIMLILVLIVYCIYFTIQKSKIENRGIKFKDEDGTFGTANWMNGEELRESFEVGTEDGIIVGKLNNEIITLPNNTLQNKNVAIFGASGSKKSRRICNTKYIKSCKTR